MRRKWMSVHLGLIALFFAALAARAVPVSRAPGDLEPDKVAACSEVEKTEGVLVLATSQRGGTYLDLGQALADQTKELKIQVCQSRGSVENIGLLAAGEADFAIVQSDVAHRAWHLHKPFNNLVQVCEGDESNEEDLEGLKLGDWVKRVCKEHDLTEDNIKDLKLVTPLHAEKVHVLVRPHLYISTTSELKGKTVSLGPKGSGTALTAQAVLEASDLSTSDTSITSIYDLSLKDATKEIKQGRIDAVFWTGAVPTPLLEEVLKDSEVRLIRLGREVINRLVEGESYIPSSVPNGTYPNQKKLVPTVAVQAFLLTRGDGGPAGVDKLAGILKDHQEAIERKAGVQLEGLGRKVSEGLRSRVHRKALPYIYTGFWINILAIVLAIAGLSVLFLMRSRIRGSLKGREQLLLALSVLIAIWILGSLGLYLFEHTKNENFDEFGKSVLSMLVYITGGFEVRVPMTRGGEVVAVVATALGVALLTWVAARLGTPIIQKELKRFVNLLRGRAMPTGLKDHIVIVNWDERTKEMIQQLIGKNFPEEQKKHVVVVSETGVELPEEDEFEGVTEIIGNPISKTTLNRAAVQHAHSVTILSAWLSGDPAEPRKRVDADVADTKTIMAILAIRELCKKENEARKQKKLPVLPQVPITAEIRAQHNCESATNIGQEGEIEIVCAENFGANVLTQCAVTPGLAAVYTRLLTFTQKTNEIYKRELPKHFVGKRFGDLLRHFAGEGHRSKEAIIPIGIYRAPNLFLNPRDDDKEPGTLEADDDLFAISRRPE